MTQRLIKRAQLLIIEDNMNLGICAKMKKTNKITIALLLIQLLFIDVIHSTGMVTGKLQIVLDVCQHIAAFKSQCQSYAITGTTKGVFYNRGVCYVAKLPASTSWDIASTSCFDFTNQKQGHLAHPNNDEVLNWLGGIAAINTGVCTNMMIKYFKEILSEDNPLVTMS
jgi:hypothetical protein